MSLIEEDTGENKVWQIVGEPEADALEGSISVTSPIARALIGNRAISFVSQVLKRDNPPSRYLGTTWQIANRDHERS